MKKRATNSYNNNLNGNVKQEVEEEKSKRRRVKTARFDTDTLDNNEQKLIQQAMKNSQKETKRVEIPVPDAPVFYPTVDEFKDPLSYINKIRPHAEAYGICKIVPPENWNPTCKINMANPKKFPTKLQNIHTLQEGEGFDDGENYNIKDYKEMADKFASQWSQKYYNGNKMTKENISKDYWNIVETSTLEVEVEYANDIDTVEFYSGFPASSVNQNGGFSGAEDTNCPDMFSDDYYARTGWNLTNLPKCKGSLLDYLKTSVNGINVPWLYIGMLFTTFCWHNEDNFLYSINYSHFGDDKQWYGVPSSETKAFEKVTKDFLLESFRESPDLLHHMTTQISPSLFLANNIPVYQVQQNAKTFVVTFPKAFHAGFSYGFNVGEAVNFATMDWLVAGGQAEERYRSVQRASVFSHQRLLFTLLHHGHAETISTLPEEVMRALEEELTGRPSVLKQGVKSLSDRVKLPPNNFSTIDLKAMDYDDMRTCSICKYFCIFSAIACQCDKKKVSCLRHFQSLCKCPNTKKYLLMWADDSDLRQTLTNMSQLVHEKSLH